LEQRMVAELRDICRRYSTDDFSVTVFQPFFIYIDQVHSNPVRQKKLGRFTN
jgi:hypothetical protein